MSHKDYNVTDEGGVHGLEIESGEFTPAIVGLTTAGEGTYIKQIGVYYKIGKLVHVEIFLDWSAHTGTGNMRIIGLPFVPSTYRTTLVASTFNISLSEGHVFNTFLSAPSAYIGLRQTNHVTSIPIPIDTEGQIRIAGSYLTA